MAEAAEIETNKNVPATYLMKLVLENPELSPNETKILLNEIRKARPALEDRWIYRWVVYFLGGAVLLTVGGTLLLLYLTSVNGIEIPDGIIALGSTAIGALAGLLANRGGND